MNIIKEYLYGLFILIVAFSYSIFFIAQVGLAIPEESALFRIYSGILMFMTLIIFLFNMSKMPNGSNMKALLIIGIVVFLFYFTRLFYDYTNSRYQTYFLSMGVRFVPAIMMGVVMLTDNTVLRKIEKALLPFMLFYTYALSSAVFSVNVSKLHSNLAIYNNNGSMNYQNLSYFSIYAFGMTLYLIANGSYKKWSRFVLVSLVFLQLYLAMSAGGRGAFVLAIVFAVYYGRYNLSRESFVKFVVLGLFAVGIFSIVFSGDARFEYGFSRISSFFADNSAVENDNRWIRWGLAWNAFLRSPLWGHGIGSVFYEVGFYSHNIFIDMLCEGGVILFAFFSILLLRFYRRVRDFIKMDKRNEIMVILFLSSFVLLCFSGYYLSETGMWLALTYILLKK